MNRNFPLGLPPGSVRALLAAIILGVWAALELGAGPTDAAPDAVRALAASVAADYGLMRTRAEAAPTIGPAAGHGDNPAAADRDTPAYAGEHHAR